MKTRIDIPRASLRTDARRTVPTPVSAHVFDDELQGMLEQLSRALSVPISVVSIVLHQTQFSRTHRELRHRSDGPDSPDSADSRGLSDAPGLPDATLRAPDAAVNRASDCAAAFCQFVVRDHGPLEASDATSDARAPRDLVQRSGIRSWLGFPLGVNGEIVGWIFGIDVVPRRWDEAQRDLALVLAQSASHRLAELSGRSHQGAAAVHVALLGRAVKPTFGEIRNALGPLTTNIAGARDVCRQLGHLVHLAEESQRAPSPGDSGLGIRSLADANVAIDDLRACLSDAEDAGRQLCESLYALEKAIVPIGASTELSDLIGTGAQLAHHTTKLIGGVEVHPYAPERVDVSRELSVSTLAMLLASIGERASRHGGDSPIRLSVQRHEGSVEIVMHSPRLPAWEYTAMAAELSDLCATAADMALFANEHGLRLRIGKAHRPTVPVMRLNS